MKLTFAAALLVLPLGGGLLIPQAIPHPGTPAQSFMRHKAVRMARPCGATTP